MQYKEKRYKRCKYQKSNYLFEDDGLAEDNKLATENLLKIFLIRGGKPLWTENDSSKAVDTRQIYKTKYVKTIVTLK